MTDAALLAALAESQRLGFLGDRPIPEVVDHAMAFVHALAGVDGGTVVDLGTGGGVPGLVIAVHRPDLRLVLVDRRASRADHVARLVGRLRLGARVSVQAVDAGAVVLPAPAVAVVARGFGPPTVTARAATPLLAPDGRLVVSEPPRSDVTRWPGTVLRELGLEAVPGPDPRVAVFRRVSRGTSAAPNPDVSRET